jgi:hypothetical protein
MMFSTSSTHGTATIPPTSSHGASTIANSINNSNSGSNNQGLRSAVQGFFKTHATTATTRSSSSNEYIVSDLHLSTNYGNESVPAGQRANSADSPAQTITSAFFYEPKSNAKKSQRISEADLKMVIQDTESFHRIQQALRDRCAQTDALVKQIGIELIEERLMEVRRIHQIQENAKRTEQRKLHIARELTEARIKARQALKLDDLTPVKRDSPLSSSDDEHRPGIHQTTTSSPTSVTAMLNVDGSSMGTFKAGLDEEASEDGDIQELDE